MQVVVQRVKTASVEVHGKVISKIGRGLLVYVGFECNDTKDLIDKMVEKLINFRIMDDGTGFLNRSILDTNLSIMIIPNFTLAGTTTRGRRPSFDYVLNKNESSKFYEYMLKKAREYEEISVGYGVFGADMQIFAQNDGPVNFILTMQND